MKLFSKIISAVAALSMVATMAVMPVAHAEGATLKLTATPAGDKSYVDVVVSYSGLTEGMKSMGIVVNFDNSLFTYPTVSGSKFKKGSVAGWGTGLDEDQIDGGSITFAQQATQIKFAFTTTETDEEYLLHASCDSLMSMRFNVTNGAESSVWTDGYTFTFADSTIGSYKTYENTLAMDTTDAKIGGQVAPTTYTVTAGEGIASVDKATAAAGETVTATPAAAETGYELDKIYVNNVESTAAFEMPAENVTVTATFKKINYAITGTGVTVAATANYGDTVNFKVDVPSGKQIADITVNGESIGKDATSFTMPAAAATVVATFEDIPVTTYAVTAGEGIASVDKATAAEGETVNFVVAEAPAGQQLADITVNGTSIGKDATSFTMPAAEATVAATFENIPVAEALFETKEATANNAVGFAAILKAIANFDSVKEAGFVFANVDEVNKEMQTSQIKAADAVQIDEAFTYEFKGLDGFDQFGLKALPYVVTDKDEVVWGVFFGSLIDIVK